MTFAPSPLAARIETAFPGIVARNVPLAKISRWRIGGPADALVEPRDVAELCRLRAFLAREEIAYLVVGATSNLLFSDAGVRAALVRLGPGFERIAVEGEEIRVGAGAWVPLLARRAMQAGLAGIEHICGIPGTLGGLVCMNGGSQRRGIGEAIVEVTSVDAQGLPRLRPAGDCGFAYRRSVFQEADEVVVEARLRLAPARDRAGSPGAARREIRRRMLAIMGDRRRKFPHRTPNCGSVFVSNPAMYAEFGPPGAVIEQLGFKGRRRGGAEVSPLHANFIVNTGGATAADVLALVTEIKEAVHARTGYDMEIEARYVRSDGALLAPVTGNAHPSEKMSA